MIDRNYFVETMEYICNLLYDADVEDYDADVVGLCTSMVSVFAWVFDKPQLLFFTYIGMINGGFPNYLEYLMSAIPDGDMDMCEVIDLFGDIRDARGLKTAGDLYDFCAVALKSSRKLN